jgi:hypothetical protein
VKRIAAVVLVALAVGATLQWLRAGSDEEQIRGQLTRLASALTMPEGANVLLRGTTMRSELDAIFEEDVRVSIPELPTTLPNGRDELADTATQLSTMFRSVDVELTDIEIKLDDARQTARVGATAKLSATGRAGPNRDSRSTDFLFNKREGTWRIASVTVWAKGDAPPP